MVEPKKGQTGRSVRCNRACWNLSPKRLFSAWLSQNCGAAGEVRETVSRGFLGQLVQTSPENCCPRRQQKGGPAEAEPPSNPPIARLLDRARRKERQVYPGYLTSEYGSPYFSASCRCATPEALPE
jgi:hypothetical protein